MNLNTGESEVTEAVIQESEDQAQHARRFLEQIRLSFPQVNQVAHFYRISLFHFLLNFSFLQKVFGMPRVPDKSVHRITKDWLITNRGSH